MTGDLDVYGVFVPELLGYAVIAMIVQSLLSRALVKLRVDRFFWHPSILELSTFVICLGGVAAMAHWGRP